MKIPPFIKQLAKVCDHEQSRFALGGIKCEADGTTAKLTATDGRILATIHYPDDHAPLDVIADTRELARAPAALWKKGPPPRFNGKALCVGQNSTPIDAIDGRFPKYEDIFTIHDQPDGYVAVKLDAALLRKLCDLSNAMNDDQHKGKGITLFVKDSKSCVFGTTQSEDGEHVARLAIMPLATDDEEYKHAFPARPGAEPAAAESGKKRKAKTPAPPPETLDDDTIAEAVAREPEPVVSACGLIECDPL
jgi:hypothetical protein